MNLTERQISVLEGRICPKCGGESKIIDCKVAFNYPQSKYIAICHNCNMFTSCKKTNGGWIPDGRLAPPNVNGLRYLAKTELKRIFAAEVKAVMEDEWDEEVQKIFTDDLGLPEEYAKLTCIGFKSFGKLFQSIRRRGAKYGIRINEMESGKPCDLHNGIIEIGASACHGCPMFLHQDGTTVWCDPDLSYGFLKTKNKEK